MSDHAQLREALLVEAEGVAARVRKIEAHLRGVDRDAPDDWSDRAQFLENDEVLEALDNHERERLNGILATLKRIEAGTYGACSSCNKTIPEGRLAALPTTSLCVKCAA